MLAIIAKLLKNGINTVLAITAVLCMAMHDVLHCFVCSICICKKTVIILDRGVCWCYYCVINLAL